MKNYDIYTFSGNNLPMFLNDDGDVVGLLKIIAFDNANSLFNGDIILDVVQGDIIIMTPNDSDENNYISDNDLEFINLINLDKEQIKKVNALRKEEI